MNDKITASTAREISMERLVKKRTIDIDHIEQYACDEIIKQAKKGYYFAKIDTSIYAQHNEIGSAAVTSAFYHDIRPRLEERGFVVTCPPFVIFSESPSVFLIRWDKEF